MNVALVGYGNFGKKYYQTLKKSKLYKNIYIYRKNKKINSNFLTLSSLKKNKIDVAIVVTPIETHYKIAKLFLNLNIPIILEKPVSKEISEIEKLNLLSRKKRISVIVNYSDLFNQNYLNIKKKIINRKKIKQLNINFKSTVNYTNKNFLPILDWLPHYFAIYFSFFNSFSKVSLKKLVTVESNKTFSQFFEINIFKDKKNISNFYFNNILKKKVRKFELLYNNKKILYDGYKIKKKEDSPLELILKKLYYSKSKKKYFNDLTKSIKIHRAINKLI